MIEVIRNLQEQRIKTLACCCGHKRYPITIIIDIGKDMVIPLEIFSNKVIERKKKFYKKDSAGYYYIPEISKPF